MQAGQIWTVDLGEIGMLRVCLPVPISLNSIGAESRNRTGTLSPARDFESRASTYSAISATQGVIMA